MSGILDTRIPHYCISVQFRCYNFKCICNIKLADLEQSFKMFTHKYWTRQRLCPIGVTQKTCQYIHLAVSCKQATRLLDCFIGVGKLYSVYNYTLVESLACAYCTILLLPVTSLLTYVHLYIGAQQYLYCCQQYRWH